MGIYLRAITFRRLIIALSLALLFCSQLFAQVVTSDSLLFENKIFDESFKTIIFSKLNNNLSEPVLALNSNEKLKLQFDDLSEETKDLSFTFIHYDRDGKKSNLTESDYINGFNFDHILNYKNSFNTIQNFYHYEIIIPNENIQPIISGNYLLVVYDNSNPEKVYLTQRFWITENTATLSTKVQRANDIEIRNTHQEIDVKVNIGTTKINNPYEDSKLVIVQNNNFKNAITTLKPVFIVDKEWDYNYDLENTFEGGNEFRNFDVRSIKFLTQYIDHVQIDSLNKLTSVYLKREEKKNTQRYAVSDDINGRFLIKIYEGSDDALEADYVYVNFNLPVMEAFDSAEVFLFGELSNWEFNPAYSMSYNEENGCYDKTLLVKQGYYNYLYFVKEKSSNFPSPLLVEGSHFETRNNYQFFFYSRDIGSRYDRLSGYLELEN
ncbi:MAG: DUF5103 domain-containing protein [Bacteroidota bacterium]|jgi:ribosomal 50S subunit-recycling heat shock protein